MKSFRTEGMTMTCKLILTCIVSLSTAVEVHAQWTRQTTPADSAIFLTVEFVNSDVGCAGGWTFDQHPAGRACYTTNGGIDWQLSLLPESTWSIITIQSVDAQTMYAAGNRETGGPYLLPRTPVPSRSRVLRAGPSMLLGRMQSDELSAVAPYRGMFLKSTDAGVTWSPEGTLPDSVYYLLGLSFPTPQIGYVSADIQSTAQQGAALLRTTDGGMSWTKLILPTPVNQIRNVYFADSLRGFAVGFQRDSSTFTGTILRTLDGGATWVVKGFTEADEVTDLSFPDDSLGYAIGSKYDKGTVFKTSDFGEHWTSLAFSPESVFLYGVRSSGSRTIVYGAWMYEWSGSPGPISSKSLPYIASTTDGGVSWARQEAADADTGQLLVGGTMLSEDNIYLSGGDPAASALMLHTTNGGISFSEDGASTLPLEAQLSQNYPNPFNPSTTIRYELNGTSHITLALYDILGRELQTLVDEVQHAGSHTVVVHAAGMSSGVYLYRLRGEGFTETRKLVVVK